MQLHINQDKKEIKAHGSYGFPVHVSLEMLSRYERGSFQWHWHPELEFTYVEHGEINYQVNETTYHLKQGEGLFGNTNTPHTGRMRNGKDCTYISTTVHPRILSGYENSVLQHKYTDRILNNNQISAIHLTPAVPWQETILKELRQIRYLDQTRADGYEIEIQICLLRIWSLIYQESCKQSQPASSSYEKNMERIKEILSFIHTHYAEKITLQDIADSVNICRSECCRFFKKHMQESLFDYLLYYRTQQSLGLLGSGDLSVTEIAHMTGFTNASYFTKVFRNQMGCSPTEYRRQLKEE